MAFQFGNKSSSEKTVKQIKKDVQGDDVNTPKSFTTLPLSHILIQNKKQR
jgi:hypothetical protein